MVQHTNRRSKARVVKTTWPQTTGLGQTTSEIRDAILSAALHYGVAGNLALAVAQQESGLIPQASSPVGAIGIFQLMPATAAWLGVDPWDWQQNVDGGVRYLKYLLDKFGTDLHVVLAAYNWGEGNVSQAIKNYGANWLTFAPLETRNYVGTITASLGTSTASPGVLTAGLNNTTVALLIIAGFLLLRS